MKFPYVKLPTKEGKFVDLPLIDVVLPFGDISAPLILGQNFVVLMEELANFLDWM